jgi:hypothetical protein
MVVMNQCHVIIPIDTSVIIKENSKENVVKGLKLKIGRNVK